MPIKCGHCHNEHSTVTEVKVCAGIIRPIAPVRPFETHAPIERTTEPQLEYVANLGGDRLYAATLGKVRCSAYIDSLKRGTPMSTPAHQPKSDPKLDMLNNLIDVLPDGRYAIRRDESEAFIFLRVKRHTRGRLNGCLTIQTQHSDKLTRAGIRWASGFWSWDRRLVDEMLLVCVDHKQAAYNYAKALDHCSICGKELTDERSRWYGIGPDCETRHRSWIEWVDDTQHDGKSYEQARRYVAF